VVVVLGTMESKERDLEDREDELQERGWEGDSDAEEVRRTRSEPEGALEGTGSSEDLPNAGDGPRATSSQEYALTS
jgi:hypothetical protein